MLTVIITRICDVFKISQGCNSRKSGQSFPVFIFKLPLSSMKIIAQKLEFNLHPQRQQCVLLYLNDAWSMNGAIITNCYLLWRSFRDALFSVRWCRICWSIVQKHPRLTGTWMKSKTRSVAQQRSSSQSGKKVMAPFKRGSIRKVICKGKLTLMFTWIIIVIHKQYSILAISAVAGWKASSLLNNINIRIAWKQKTEMNALQLSHYERLYNEVRFERFWHRKKII